ncbi:MULTISPECIES: GntR family transcriptional regulator [unclassified Burkholderia]|uniref:GntR family transcriptional regulator n=1 Tax=unclassified Burkholderia TaxID=2613784 RepID=UPI0014210741|nr:MULTISPECIES: GntR family transcriptional regulator [unclassified Burkholderia]NIE83376.1 GntR family transcriptional regulator [Burkholderia sp. Tr-860]NIF61712.1 GntR family transcriptional regulator [Burkholderia sp. Cy-647]NIF70133.1 GntR family transcriptional regulator [Burkholderia sp. Ap-962]NIF96885.1 GntR family transcriptional regulator [Burkholderia sp. Ax-1720]
MDQLTSLANSIQEKRQPISSMVADALREAIFRAVLKQGESLRQDAIAKQFGVSQVTVREAFRLLAEEGIVEIVPRRGAVVASLSPADVEEIVELRVALETLLVARAIPRLDDEDFSAVEKIVRKLDKTRTMDEQLALNVDFHARLYARAERPRTLATLEKLRLAFEPYLRLLWARSDYKSHSQDDHRKIVALCRDRDVAGAQQVLAAHIATTGREIVHLLGSDAGQ